MNGSDLSTTEMLYPSTSASNKCSVSSRTLDWGVVLLSFFAFTFPVFSSADRAQSNVFKYYFLASAAAVLCFLLLLDLKQKAPLLPQVRSLRLGLSVWAILSGYSFILCGFSAETLLSAIAVPTLLLVFRSQLSCENPNHKTILWLLAGFALLTTAACFFSLHQFTALMGDSYRRTGLSTLFACLLVFCGTRILVRNQTQGTLVLKLLLLSGFVAGAFALAQFFLPHDLAIKFFPVLAKDSYPRPYGTLGHTNWFGTYLLFLLPFAIHFLMKEWRWHWVLLVGLLHASLMVGQTRGAWLAEGALLLFAVAIWRKDWRKLAGLIAILTLVTAFLLPARNWMILNRATSLSEEAQLAASGSSGAGTGRFGFWKYGLKHLPQYALLGAGLDSFEAMADEGESAPISKAHSIYLDHALSSGVVGLVLYLSFLWKCFWSQSPPEFKWAFRAMLLAYFIQGFFIHDTVQTWPILWLLAGLCLGPLAKRSTGDDARGFQEKPTTVASF